MGPYRCSVGTDRVEYVVPDANGMPDHVPQWSPWSRTAVECVAPVRNGAFVGTDRIAVCCHGPREARGPDHNGMCGRGPP